MRGEGCDEGAWELTAHQKSEKENTGAPDVDRFTCIRRRLGELSQTESAISALAQSEAHGRRMYLGSSCEGASVAKDGEEWTRVDSPYGGLPHRSRSNRETPLYLNTVARPKSEILRLPAKEIGEHGVAWKREI
jgi:hypothetical protein